MDEKFIPIDISNIFKDVDTSKLKEIWGLKEKDHTAEVDTIEFLLDSLGISSDKIKNKNTLLRNYIYCMVVARKHLLEINERLKDIKQKMNRINDKESYSFRKLKFFKKKNEDAINQITDFICHDLVKYVSERNDVYADLINRSNEENMWIITVCRRAWISKLQMHEIVILTIKTPCKFIAGSFCISLQYPFSFTVDFGFSLW